MTISNEKLLRMAEQISANLAYTNDTDIVGARIADHLGRFWDPRMLDALKALAREHPDQLTPEIAVAVRSLDK